MFWSGVDLLMDSDCHCLVPGGEGEWRGQAPGEKGALI